MKTPYRELHENISEISEHANLRAMISDVVTRWSGEPCVDFE